MKKIECVIMDWAGTAVDYGCFAPVAAFLKAFAEKGLTVTMEEARGPMGMTKIDHIRELFKLPSVTEQFKQNYNRNWTETPAEQSKQNVERAIEIIDNAVECYFTGAGMAMSRYYNPYTGSRSEELGSVWMYTSSIEAVNAVLHALKVQKEQGINELYDAHFERYKELLSKLYSNTDYYAGTYTLVSFTQTKEWTVYGVNRGRDKGIAEVEGIMNVYDDQMWLIREYLEAYKFTGDTKYLTKAEYLTEYVLDGWDCTLDANGNQNGGIPWGPGYTTKHSCSNGPLISPLVWLHELYKGKNDEITYGYVATDNSRQKKTEKKSDYYLNMAKAVYDYQKQHLLTAEGVYDDMMGGCVPNCASADDLNKRLPSSSNSISSIPPTSSVKRTHIIFNSFFTSSGSLSKSGLK